MCFNLEETKDGHYFTNGHSWHRFLQIEKTRDIFLQIQLNFEGLERRSVMFPDVLKTRIGDLLKLIDLLEEQVHIFNALVKERVLWTLYIEYLIKEYYLLIGNKSKAMLDYCIFWTVPTRSGSFKVSSSLDSLDDSCPKIMFNYY